MNADQIYPRDIASHLSMGVSGLVLSAMFAAVMARIDSGLNSITAVMMTGSVDGFGHRP